MRMGFETRLRMVLNASVAAAESGSQNLKRLSIEQLMQNHRDARGAGYPLAPVDTLERVVNRVPERAWTRRRGDNPARRSASAARYRRARGRREADARTLLDVILSGYGAAVRTADGVRTALGIRVRERSRPGARRGLPGHIEKPFEPEAVVRLVALFAHREQISGS
jgi:hypothetical protein